MNGKCPYYIKKVGGVFFGWKCAAYHNGAFTIYSEGDRIQYFTDRNSGSGQYRKEGRDKYVNEKCLSNCNSCGLYQAQQRGNI